MQLVVLCRRFATTTYLFLRSALRCLVVVALVLVCSAPASHGTAKKYVLMINELGQSHPGPVLVMNEILSALHSDARFDVEFHWENLNAVDLSDDSLTELRASVTREYRDHKFDAIVLLGPDPFRFLG